MAKRVFLVVLDSFGCGNAPDAAAFGDEGSNTLAGVIADRYHSYDNMSKMGLFDIDGLYDIRIKQQLETLRDRPFPMGSYGIIREVSSGKDSTIGHWEMAGLLSATPQPTYPSGFPDDILDKIRKVSGRDILCNKPYSGTEVIKDYGEEHMKTGALIVYTSADSVLQIAAHEEIVPLEELYDICRKVRAFMVGEHAVGRVIARPFVGEPGFFTRTSNRHDFSAPPPASTMLDVLKGMGYDVISIGKINDLFAGQGITKSIPTSGNSDGIAQLLKIATKDFNGLCYVNLVDFDMLYGHRNDGDGYAQALQEWDQALGVLINVLREDDLLIITADHGCDPSTPSTDHSRETVPLLMYGEGHRVPHNLGELVGFNCVSNYVFKALMNRDFKRPYEDIDNSPREGNLNSYIDLTNLKQTATLSDIKMLITQALFTGCASCCIPPCFVGDAVRFSEEKIKICTVIGFPNGYQTTAVKLFEAADACDNGAAEIDMVVNINKVKEHDYKYVKNEIKLIADLVHSKGAILKVIIETCFLDPVEIVNMCDVVTEAGADFIKTSTGFGPEGATLKNVALMKANVGPDVKVKAAGGIRSSADAQAMIDAGASRIGTSGLKS